MELNKKGILVKAALLLFLLGFTTTVDARFNPRSVINQLLLDGDANYYVKSTSTACCDKCFCTRSNPPICRCADVGETCHSCCKLCICTRSLPPKCQCADTTDFCYDSCTSSKAEAHEE
ncbi:Proteinase inhibitor I12, Bowman-Birk [Sesbania bispinosa]|nr:Proteinase inhibitor I12, Bowman-Birk [Sesbania bispinosa]